MVDWRYVGHRVTLFFVPIFASCIFIIILWAGLSHPMFQIIGLLLLSYFISPFGREVLIPAAVISLLTLHGTSQVLTDFLLIVAIVVFVDVMCSIFLLWNLDLLKYLPVFGKWIDGIERFGRQKLKKSRRKRQNIFLALTSYVALPFQGSGGIMSTIIGMLTGMSKKRVWLSIWIGSIIGSAVIAILSFSVGQLLIDIFSSTEWYIIGTILLLGIIIYLVWNYRQSKKLDTA